MTKAPFRFIMPLLSHAPVAQLDKAQPSEETVSRILGFRVTVNTA